MNTHLLRSISAGLLLLILDCCCPADSPPPLKELPGFALDRREFAIITRVSFSPDGKILFSTVNHQTVWLWDVASRKRVAAFDPNPKGGRFNRMVLSPDGKMAACLCDKTIELWDVAVRKHLGSLEEDEQVVWMWFSPDSKQLGLVVKMPRKPGRPRPWDDELRIWDVTKKKRLHSLDIPDWFDIRPVAADRSIKKPLFVDLYPDSHNPRLMIELQKTQTHRVRLLDAFTGESVLTCKWEFKDGVMLTFALNGAETRMASAGPRTPVLLWDRKTGKVLARFKAPDNTVKQDLRFVGPEGKILWCYYVHHPHREGLAFYAIPSGTLLAYMNVNEDLKLSHLNAWDFSPDGRLLAAGSGRGIKLWSIPEQWRSEEK